MKKPLVKSLSVITVNVPLKRPIVASLGTFEYWPYVLVEISLSDGTIGKGYIGPYLVNYTQTITLAMNCLLYTSPSPRDVEESRMPSSA